MNSAYSCKNTHPFVIILASDGKRAFRGSTEWDKKYEKKYRDRKIWAKKSEGYKTPTAFLPKSFTPNLLLSSSFLEKPKKRNNLLPLL